MKTTTPSISRKAEERCPYSITYRGTKAKEGRFHDIFTAMVERDLTISLSMANMLMAHPKDNRILNSEQVPNLPPNWGRLYQLTQLSDEQFETGLEEGWFRVIISAVANSTTAPLQDMNARANMCATKYDWGPRGRGAPHASAEVKSPPLFMVQGGACKS